MRTGILVSVFVLFPTLAWAAPPEKFYYVGEVKLTSPEGKPMGSQAILVEKTHDREHSTIIEHAITVQADGKVDEYTARLVVKDDNTFTLSDEEKTVEGSGKLFGPSWKWTYFKGTFKHKNGVQIDDENFMSDDSVGTARKKWPGSKQALFG